MSHTRAQGEPPTLAEAQALLDEATAAIRTAEGDLIATQAVVELLLEVAGPVAVVEGSTVRGWSRGLEQLTGVHADAAVGRPLSETVLDATRWVDGRGSSWEVVRWPGTGGFEAIVLSATT